MKILYDNKKCIKCGLCASIRPDIFVLSEDGVEVVKGAIDQTDREADKELMKDLKTIEEDCPVGAIKIAE